VDCFLRHEHVPATLIRLGTARHERQAAVLLDLLARHFERTRLPAAITGIGIRCEDIHVIPPESLRLIEGGAGEDRHWPRLLDRLFARLGRERLSKPVARADHRPECAASVQKVSGLFSRGTDRFSVRENKPDTFCDSGVLFRPPRPIWLLHKPARLRASGRRPEWNGPLTLSKLPERIEQGWWDGGDLRRDYYLARNAAGAQLWVYRDRDDRGWYLHGIFA
jgi:protein ImuB